MIIGILILLALGALGVIAWVIVPKIPLLSSLQVEESPQERFKRLKKHIVIGRMMRKLKEKSIELQKKIFTKERREQLSTRAKKVVTRLRQLEEHYREQTKEHKVEMLLKRGDEQLEEDSEGAEQEFLQVVRLDSHNLEAYEGLLQIYLKRKSLSEAAEVVDFLKKSNPTSLGRYAFDLAKLFLEAKEFAKARKYGEQALKDEPDSPKYLDFIIETAILDGDAAYARRYLIRLKEVNPENAKIEDFETSITALK